MNLQISKSCLYAAMILGCWSATTAGDVILEYDTGHPLGPHVLDIGVETPVQISVTDRTGELWWIAAVLFDFVAPFGGLTWDLNGPDDIDFTEDDDLAWEIYYDYATVDPPVAVYFCDIGGPPCGDNLVSAYETVLLATLMLNATHTGLASLVVGDVKKGIIFDVTTFGIMVVEDGTEQVTFLVVPECGTLVVLSVATFLSGRRRRWRSNVARPGTHPPWLPRLRRCQKG